MLWEQRVRYAALTDVGFRRQNNQDSCAVSLCTSVEEFDQTGHLFVVADGMGGHAVGELASKIAVDTVPHMFGKLHSQPANEALRIAIEAANEAIHERGSQNQDFLRMGTTCSALTLGSQGAVVGHVGDSRVYRIRNRQIDQLTFDHSLVWEMIRTRRVHPKDAERLCPRNVITRSLGPEPNVNVDIEGPFPVFPDDIFVLCSDGLSGLLSDSEIGMIAGSLSPDESCRLLVNLANLRGGPDNITVVVVHTGGVPEGIDVVYDLPASKPQIEGLSWAGFSIMCLCVAFFLMGLFFFVLDQQRRLQGGAILTMAAVAGIGYWAWHRSRTRAAIANYDPDNTVAWRPYRSAPATITDEFIELLSRMEADHHNAAIEDRWPVDWNKYEPVFNEAREAVEKRLFARALGAYGRLFDLLMSAIQHQRRVLQRENRPKKASAPSISTVNETGRNGDRKKSDPDVKPPSNELLK